MLRSTLARRLKPYGVGFRELVDALALTPHLDKTLHMLSAGSRRKVGLAAWKSGPADAHDFNRRFRPECARALHNADMFYL